MWTQFQCRLDPFVFFIDVCIVKCPKKKKQLLPDVTKLISISHRTNVFNTTHGRY